MADKSTEPILDLTTLVERPKIRIDGQLYGVRDTDEVNLVEYHRLQRLGEKVDLLSKDGLSEAETEEALKALDTACRMILEAPDEVHQKIRDSHRMQILKVFTDLHRVTAPAPAPEVKPPAPAPQATPPAPAPQATPPEPAAAAAGSNGTT
jgi:hypothetical protein